MGVYFLKSPPEWVSNRSFTVSLKIILLAVLSTLQLNFCQKRRQDKGQEQSKRIKLTKQQQEKTNIPELSRRLCFRPSFFDLEFVVVVITKISGFKS